MYAGSYICVCGCVFVILFECCGCVFGFYASIYVLIFVFKDSTWLFAIWSLFFICFFGGGGLGLIHLFDATKLW